MSVVTLLLAAPGARAQDATSSAPGVLLDHRDLGLILGATVASALMTRWDQPIARSFTDTAFHRRHRGLTTAANRTSLVTETVLMASGGLTYVVAKHTGHDETADIAFHTTEGVASAAMFIQIVRGALGRGRPYVVNDSGEVRDGDPYDIGFMRGFTSFNYRAWPSMHAMASFAAASGLATEMKRRNTPNRKIITPVLFIGATMPSLARMYLDEHWASDIAMGVFLGVFAGQKAVNYSHDHPDNPFEHPFLKPSGVRASFTTRGDGLSFSILPF